MQTMTRINWENHSNSIRKLSNSKKRFTRRFIHHRLSTSKMQFLNRPRCPYCDIMFTNRKKNHDHFLTCLKPRAQKHNRIQYLSSTLNKINTPPPLRDYILYNVSNYYSDGLHEDTESEDHKIQLMKKGIINKPL